EPGASVILRAFDRPVSGAPWPYLRPVGAPVDLRGNWSVTFLAGGPVLPASFRTDTLVSWTERGDEEARRFAGTARYAIRFDAPGWPLKPSGLFGPVHLEPLASQHR